MITLKWSDIVNPTFLSVVQSLINTKLPTETTIKVLRIAKKVNDERTLVLSVLDKNKDNLEEQKKALETSFQVDCSKIPSEHLKGLLLSVNELLALEQLLSDAEVLYPKEEEKPTEAVV